MAFVPNQFPPRDRPLPANPRRVRGGVKLRAKQVPELTNWGAQRWLRLVQQALAGDEAVEALEYARLGQTKRLAIESGAVRAPVQGRAPRPYQITIEFRTFSAEQWDKLIEQMASQAVHAAKLLAGELPSTIEDLLAPLGLKLYPTEPGEVLASTTCPPAAAGAAPGDGPAPGSASDSAAGASSGTPSGPADKPDAAPKPAPRQSGRPAVQPWSKHLGCVGYLLAERFEEDPFAIFQLRGMAPEDLLERIRQKRALAGLGDGPAPVYVPVVPGASDVEPEPLESTVDSFWHAGPELENVALSIAPPAVSHPLLRRLGASPFPGGRFPMVGLLATCYDIIAEGTLKELSGDPNGEADETDMAGDS